MYTSRQILPKNKRLSPQQIIELEGFKPARNGSFLTFPVYEKLIEYHKALEAAEEEIERLKGVIVTNENLV